MQRFPNLCRYSPPWALLLIAAACSEQTAPVPPPAATPAPFKLISYNVQARPVLDDARAAVNLPIIGGMLGEFGVADVQECFSQCDKLLAAAPQPQKYYFDDRQSIISLANSGLAGLSWYPIEKLVTTP